MRNIIELAKENKELELIDLQLDQLQHVSKKCLQFASDGNNTTCIAKKLYHLVNDFYLQHDKQGYKLYIDFGKVTYYLQHVRNYMTVLKLIEGIKTFPIQNYEDYKEDITRIANENAFINKLQLELFKVMGEDNDFLQFLLNSRNANIEAREEKRRLEEEERKRKENNFLLGKKDELDRLITEAEKQLLNNGEVFNKDIEIYSSRYDYKETTLILHLFKLYDIKVPIKTQGWINKALCKVYHNGEYFTYSYYKPSKNSTVFYKYLDQLIEAITEKHNHHVA